MSLQVMDLRKSFGDKVAVEDVSFSMDRPGVFGLIGTNGAGKTTTIRCILGIMRADGGTSVWNGQPISRESLAFGYMPEERGIYMKTRVLEQLVYFGMLRGMTAAAARSSSLEYLARLGMEEYRDRPAEQLSKGNQQKIQLIATLVHRPRLIFLDEPFSGLDPVNTELMSSLIRELVDEGCYIVMSSHQMSTVEGYCEDIMILHRGKTLLSGHLAAIKAGYGHTNLFVAAGSDPTSLAQTHGLRFIGRHAGTWEFGVDGDNMARAFLEAMLKSDIFPTRFELKEPSLHEIFLEKVGEDA